jgi:group I intron endonuclease
MTGVYQIICRSTGKRYVGSAFNIALRWNAHRRDLRADHHCNPKLQNAWNKYGEADFTFETLLECREVERLEKEQFFLDFFGAVEAGFNVATIAGSRKGVPQPLNVGLTTSATWKGKKRPAETIARMRAAQSNRSPEWKSRIATAKKKANGATRRPMALEKRLHMARSFRRSAKTKLKMSAAAFEREARKRQLRLENA